MSGNIHISSLIVQAHPGRLAEISREITKRGGEIPASDPDGKLVVVLETNSETKITDFLNEVAVMPGVLSANLVFHHNDHHEPDLASQTPTAPLGDET